MGTELKDINRIKHKGAEVQRNLCIAQRRGIPMSVTVSELPKVPREGLRSVIDIIESSTGALPEPSMTTIAYEEGKIDALKAECYQIRWPGGSLSVMPQLQKKDPNIIKGVEVHLDDTDTAARGRERSVRDLLAGSKPSLAIQLEVVERLANLFLTYTNCFGCSHTLWGDEYARNHSVQANSL